MKLAGIIIIYVIITGFGCVHCTITRFPARNLPDNRNSVFSSNLPLIVIDTKNRAIPNTSRIVADMGIIYNGNGKMNVSTDRFNDYHGKVSIEIRGSSSRKFPKKSYRLQTQDNNNMELDVSLLGLPHENDWILYAPYNDKSLMRDVLAYKISRDMGRYASRTRYVELILNGTYQGIYVLEEKIKCDANRVNIHCISKGDTTGIDLTGGYILKLDKPMDGEKFMNPRRVIRMITHPPIKFGKKKSHIKSKKTISTNKYFIESAYLPPGAEWQIVEFRFHAPGPDEITSQQATYLREHISKAETALYNPGFTDPDSGYRRYFDTGSLIDHFILCELSRNIDAYRTSTFFYKDRDDRGGKITMGPIWDYNLSMGNVNFCEGQKETGWAYQFNDICPSHAWLVPFWWDRLLQDPHFKNELKCRWTGLRNTVLKTESLLKFIDGNAMPLKEAQQRNYERWHILGKYVWPNYKIYATFEEEINYLKRWLTDRLKWMDENMPGACEMNYSRENQDVGN